jgi:hypothetical protein
MASKLLQTTAIATMLACSAMAVESTQMGVGVGLSNDTATLRLPINLAKDLRVEPEFGLSYVSNDNFDQTGLLIGSGLYMMQQPSKAINLYYGGKLLIDYSKYDPDQGSSDSTTQFVLGGVFGFEYMIDRQVGIGGEAGAYLGLGDATTLQTQGQALLRYYF